MKKGTAVRVLSACALLFVFTLVSDTGRSVAESTKEEYRRLQKELRSQQRKLEGAKKTERSVLEDLHKTGEELADIENRLDLQKKKTLSLQRAIVALRRDIDRNERNLELQRERLKKRLRALQRITRETDALLVLITEEDTATMFKAMRYLSDISRHDQEMVDKYLESLKRLGQRQDELTALFGKLKSEEEQLARLDDSLEEKKKERERLLIAVRKEKRSYERSIAELKESSNQLLKFLRDSEKREQEARRKKDTRQPPSKEEAEGDSQFVRRKGMLPWPAQGSVMIPYGSQTDPVLDLPVFRSGIHIKAPLGTHVKAVSGGKIVYADSFKGYGQLVILTHGGGYHSLYGNLGKIFLRNGAIIRDDQTIGEVGESSILGSSGLYFEIRYKGKPLDPQQWLKK
jgi:septal ring factor EnvC (AmiA/AmiB activator)